MKKITIEPLAHDFIFATPSAAEQPLSKTFMYVANTTGELLFSAQLTQQMLWRMVAQRPKIKSNEHPTHNLYQSLVEATWFFCDSHPPKSLIQDHCLSVAQTLGWYFSDEKEFIRHFEKGFEHGLHLLLIGWPRQHEWARVCSLVLLSDRELSEYVLKNIVEQTIVYRRHTHPKDFPNDSEELQRG